MYAKGVENLAPKTLCPLLGESAVCSRRVSSPTRTEIIQLNQKVMARYCHRSSYFAGGGVSAASSRTADEIRGISSRLRRFYEPEIPKTPLEFPFIQEKTAKP
jgi:hypothetical protein